MFKAANNFDIYDPDTQEMIMTCREDSLGFFTKMFRFTDYKRMTPFEIKVKASDGSDVLTVKRGTTFWMSKVEVYNERHELVGYFKQQFFSIGGKFNVYNPDGVELCKLQGKWTSWDFKFIKDKVEFAKVGKQWAGLGKELFTSADNYILSITDQVPQNNPLRVLILAAVLCIDMVLKE